MFDLQDRHFFYVCPQCGAGVESCPDPACSEERVGHHIIEGDCLDDVPLSSCTRHHTGHSHDSWCQLSYEEQREFALPPLKTVVQ